METVTISIATLKKLVDIADDYLAGEYVSELSQAYFIGKRDAYQNIIDNYTTTN
jgi:hypothetical protein